MSLVPTSQTPHALRYEIAPPRLPELGPAELAELAMPGRAWRRETKAARARRIKRDARKGRQALDGMAKAGDIGLEKRRSGWRILPPGDIVDRFRR